MSEAATFDYADIKTAKDLFGIDNPDPRQQLKIALTDAYFISAGIDVKKVCAGNMSCEEMESIIKFWILVHRALWWYDMDLKGGF